MIHRNKKGWPVDRDWLETGEGEMFKSVEPGIAGRQINEIGKAYHGRCDKDIVCRMICASCANSPPEDREAYLMLKAILESDQEGTKLAIKQNLREFVRLVKPAKPPPHKILEAKGEEGGSGK